MSVKSGQAHFADAAKWLDVNDSERWDFKPSNVRRIGGFDRKEYANHCEAGGHPHPRGRQLLELQRKMSELQRTMSGGKRELDTTRLLWLDFAFHCDRTWRALTDLLLAQHARFDRVRSEAITAVAESRATWQQSDALAQHAGLVLGALDADPTTPLSDLLDLDD